MGHMDDEVRGRRRTCGMAQVGVRGDGVGEGVGSAVVPCWGVEGVWVLASCGEVMAGE